jgi:hypothetical protein
MVLAGFLAVVASGCATAPSGGAPQRLQRQSGQQAAFAEPLPPPKPDANWQPDQVVRGFLAASADFKLDPAAAKQYLAPDLAWNPPGKAGITVVSGVLKVTPATHLNRLPGAESEQVTVYGQRLASLSNRGQYRYQPGNATYTFDLARYNGVWLIQSLPSDDPLLLTEASFEQVFQPRNLYFWDLSWKFLVPDPVFAPLQGPTAANATTLVRTLVQGLLPQVNAPSSWLTSATLTAFPTGTTLARNGVTINNLTALVDLQVTTAISPSALDKMYDQLFETLTSNSYVQSVVAHVKMAINGKVRRVSEGAPRVPPVGSTTEPLYFAAGGQISRLRAGATKPLRVNEPAQLLGTPDITAVAVSRSAQPKLAVAVRNGTGCAVFVGPAGWKLGYKTYTLPAHGGACTSLSWDSANNVWAVAGSLLWILQPHSGPRQVTLPTTAGINPPGSRVLALRMGPDGVRAAFLVHTLHGGNRLLLAAVSYAPGSITFGDPVPVGASLLNPTAIGWYNPDDLLALDGTELYQVPLTGGAAQPLGAVPGPVVSIASSGHVLAVRTKAGQIYTLPVSAGGSWTLVHAGTTPAEAGPAYPG